MVPLLWRAKSQLKMNVRALPTWRNPVGEGAKRTRGDDGEGVGSDIVLKMILSPRAVTAALPQTHERPSRRMAAPINPEAFYCRPNRYTSPAVNPRLACTSEPKPVKKYSGASRRATFGVTLYSPMTAALAA